MTGILIGNKYSSLTIEAENSFIWCHRLTRGLSFECFINSCYSDNLTTRVYDEDYPVNPIKSMNVIATQDPWLRLKPESKNNRIPII